MGSGAPLTGCHHARPTPPRLPTVAGGHSRGGRSAAIRTWATAAGRHRLAPAAPRPCEHSATAARRRRLTPAAPRPCEHGATSARRRCLTPAAARPCEHGAIAAGRHRLTPAAPRPCEHGAIAAGRRRLTPAAPRPCEHGFRLVDLAVESRTAFGRDGTRRRRPSRTQSRRDTRRPGSVPRSAPGLGWGGPSGGDGESAGRKPPINMRDATRLGINRSGAG